jgi:hypothetical protein
MTDTPQPQPPYPVKLPVTWPEDTPFDELPPGIQRAIRRALGEPEDG